MADQGGKIDIATATNTLKTLKNLRNNVGVLFQNLTDGIGTHGQESKEAKESSKEGKFVSELQHLLVSVQTSLRQVKSLLFSSC